MNKILQTIILVFSTLLLMLSSCTKPKSGIEPSIKGCKEEGACNYDPFLTEDDGSCWFASEGCDCDDPLGAIIDCLGVCDTDISNNPPDDDGDGNCNEDVIGGCIDTTICNYNQFATHNNDSCAVDLSQYGGYENGIDCEGLCEGKAVIDDCENHNCIGGELNNLGAWKIIISANATFNSTISGTLLAIDSSIVTLGVSEFALDGYNDVEQEGGSTDCGVNCYIDIIENPPVWHDNSIRFYFPHVEWVNEFDSSNFSEADTAFVQDIRYYDLYAVFSTGILWSAVIKPINILSTYILEKISISYKFEGAISHCMFNISINGSPPELIEEEIKEYGVNSNEEIELIFNISNVCTDTF